MNLKKTGELIKLKRKELGITQEELAKKLNVTEKAISRWETGRGAPDISLLIPLSKELNVSVLEILNGEKVEDENKIVVNILKEGNKKLNIFKRILLVVIDIIFILSLMVCIYGHIIPKRYEGRITTMYSPSMNPTIKINESVVYDIVDIKTIKENDIVVYYNEGFKVVHRVVKVLKDENNNVKLTTKGDNNLYNDENYVTKDNFIGIYSKKISKISNLFVKNGTKVSIFTFMILTVLNIVIVILNIRYIKKK